jgi:hypothetical protein
MDKIIFPGAQNNIARNSNWVFSFTNGLLGIVDPKPGDPQQGLSGSPLSRICPVEGEPMGLPGPSADVSAQKSACFQIYFIDRSSDPDQPFKVRQGSRSSRQYPRFSESEGGHRVGHSQAQRRAYPGRKVLAQRIGWELANVCWRVCIYAPEGFSR